MNDMSIADVLADFADERDRQDAKWGPNRDHPDVSARPFIPTQDIAKAECDKAHIGGRTSWSHIIEEELAEAYDELSDGNLEKGREELVQCGAVITAWIQAIDRRRRG